MSIHLGEEREAGLEKTEDAAPWQDSAVKMTEVQARKVPVDKPWLATITSFRDDAFFQQYMEILKGRRGDLEPDEGEAISTLSLRLPESLHKQLEAVAERNGVSINQFVATAVAEKLSALMTADYLEERAARGDRADSRACWPRFATCRPRKRIEWKGSEGGRWTESPCHEVGAGGGPLPTGSWHGHLARGRFDEGC